MVPTEPLLARDPAGQPPWATLPPELAWILRPTMPGVAQQIIRTVTAEIPAYAQARDGQDSKYERNLQAGVLGALKQFLTLPGSTRPALDEDLTALVARLGAGEFREGRSMDALLRAYRTGARITLRTLSTVCSENGMGPEVVIDLGESVLAYLDELSAVSVQAFAREQSAQAGTLQLRRRELLDALLKGAPDRASLRHLAAAAGWSIPARMVAVVMPVESGEVARHQLGLQTLVAEYDVEAVAVVPVTETPDAESRLAEQLAGTGAVVGTPSAVDTLPASLRLARLLVSVRGPMPESVDPHSPLTFVADHLRWLVLAAEPQAVRALERRLLAPLEGLTENKRAPLEETLLSWLRHWGARNQVAQELGVHPQTVGYRIGRLRELLGTVLDDVEDRHDLALVLSVRAARRPQDR